MEWLYLQCISCQTGGILEAKETVLGSIIKESEQLIQYDDRVKQVLSHKSILAVILKGCVREFEGIRLEEIVNSYILEMGEKVSGIEVSDLNYYYREVRYDVLFDVVLPKSGRMAIVDIEPQKEEPKSYSILSRGTYYCGRLISGQYGTVFDNSDYGKLRKVYSIWICMNPENSNERNSITRYYVDEECLIGKVKADTDVYNYQEIIVIGLDNNAEEGLVGFLSTLLSMDMSYEEKKQILESKYDFVISKPIEKDVKNVGNLGEWVLETGYDRGYDRGYDGGYDSAKIETYNELISRGVKEKTALEILKITKEDLKKPSMNKKMIRELSRNEKRKLMGMHVPSEEKK